MNNTEVIVNNNISVIHLTERRTCLTAGVEVILDLTTLNIVVEQAVWGHFSE